MIRSGANSFCAGFLALLLSSCTATFQSTQFNFVKGLFSQESLVPEKNWQVRWQGKTYPVFAVNHDGGTFFADEHGFVVSFDGWQVRHVSTLQSKEKTTTVIEKTTADDGVISLDYMDRNERRLAQDKCQAWKRTTGRGWEQDCKSAENAGVDASGYTNTIELDANGAIVALRFKVLPGSDPIQISLNR